MSLGFRMKLFTLFLSDFISLSFPVQGHYNCQNCNLQTVTLIIAWGKKNCACQFFTERPLLPIADRTKLKPDPQVLPHICERKKACFHYDQHCCDLSSQLLTSLNYFLPLHRLTLKHLEVLTLNSERFLLILYVA